MRSQSMREAVLEAHLDSWDMQELSHQRGERRTGLGQMVVGIGILRTNGVQLDIEHFSID